MNVFLKLKVHIAVPSDIQSTNKPYFKQQEQTLTRWQFKLVPFCMNNDMNNEQ